MFNSKCVKHLLSLVLCILLLFINLIPCFAESSLSFNSVDFDTSCYVINADETQIETEVKVYTNRNHQNRVCTQFIFGGNSEGVSKNFALLKLRNLSSTKEYNLNFSIAINSGSSREVSFNAFLRYVSPNGTVIQEQPLLENVIFTDNYWKDFNFNFVPLSMSGQAYSLYLVFEFSSNYSTSTIMHFSPEVVLVDIDDSTPFYNLILNLLEKIDNDILALNSNFITFNDTFNTNFGDFLTNFGNFSDSFNTTLTDILDLTFGDFLTDFGNFTDSFNTTFNTSVGGILNGLNINLGNLNSNISNQTQNLSGLQTALDNIYTDVHSIDSVVKGFSVSLGNLSNINSTLNTISSTLNSLMDSVSSSLNTMNSTLSTISTDIFNGFSDVSSAFDNANNTLDSIEKGEEVKPDDFSSEGADGFNSISDELESSDSQLPQLSQDVLDNSFDSSIISELNLGFMALNNVFDVVTSALGFTSVLVFLMGFGLAVYIIGRRLGS